MKISIKEAFDFTGEKFVENILFYMGVSVIVVLAPVVLSIALGVLAIIFGNAVESLGSLLLFLTPVISFIFFSFLLIGVTEIVLSDKEGSELSYEKFSEKSSLTVNFAVGTLLYALISTIGLILFIVPGIYLAIRFSFFDFALVEEESGPISALKKSWDITRGYGWSLLFFMAILLPLSFFLMTGLAPLGLLICTPFMYLARADVYDQIK